MVRTLSNSIFSWFFSELLSLTARFHIFHWKRASTWDPLPLWCRVSSLRETPQLLLCEFQLLLPSLFENPGSFENLYFMKDNMQLIIYYRETNERKKNQLANWWLGLFDNWLRLLLFLLPSFLLVYRLWFLRHFYLWNFIPTHLLVSLVESFSKESITFSKDY